MRDLVLGRAVASDPLGARRLVSVPPALRFRHLYAVGKSGKGKSVFLHRLIHQDVRQPYATVVFDAGDLATDVLAALPAAALPRVLFFSVARPLAYNPFLRRRDEPARLENELFALMDQVTAEGSSTAPLSARMKRLLRTAIRAVVRDETPSFATLGTYLMTHKGPLRTALQLREDEFATTWEAVVDRLSPFLGDPRIRRVICAPHALDFGTVIDAGKILLVSLAGLEPPLKRFLGTLLFHGLQSTILERDAATRRPVAIYIDEFHDYLSSSYAAENFQTLFSQGRKFQASVAVAHTDFAQIPPRLLQTIHATAASLVAFSCGPEEARVMSENFARDWPPEAISLLPDHHAIGRVGEAIHLFETAPPLPKLHDSIPAYPRRAALDPPDPFEITHQPHAERNPYNHARKPHRGAETPPAA